MADKTITIAIVDDSDIYRDGLKLALGQIESLKIVYDSPSSSDFLSKLTGILPDVVLMDIQLPVLNGIDATRKALKIVPSLKVIALTMHNSPVYYKQMIDAGAKGYILKKSGKKIIKEAIEKVYMGEKYIGKEILIIENSDK